MRSFRDISIRRKLIILLAGVVSVSVALSYSIFVVNDVRMIESSLANHLVALADVIGENCTAALGFEVPSSAHDVLRSIGREPSVVYAQVYNKEDLLFTEFVDIEFPHMPPPPLRRDGHPFSANGYLHVFRPIMKDNERLGTVYLQASRERINNQLRQYAVVVAVTLALSLGVTILLAIPLQRLISKPILQLVGASQQVATYSDFSIRVPKAGNDELGDLCDAFNAMLAQIQQRDVELEEHRSHLEELVEERTKDLASKVAELARSNTELQEFAFVASHDLQEPLRKIQAFGDMLQTRFQFVVDEESKDYLSRMQNAATRMRALIDGLLNYSRIASKGQAFEEVDLVQLVKSVVSDLEGRIKQTGGRVEIGSLPLIQADHTQIRQLMQNLIGNGLKFHRPGVPPVVKVRGEIISRKPLVDNAATTDTIRSSTTDTWSANCEPAGNSSLTETGMVCRLTIEDNGIGFDEKYVDRIFTPFQRLHGHVQYEGTGIGLAVCRKIVERHQGTISARSQPNQGSRFIVTLPLSQSYPRTSHEYLHQSNHDSYG